MKAFISYSHKDSATLERLHVHLANLRREGHIEAWFDREILAGDVLDDAIDRELESASIVLLLVSADFINSDYCFDKEMQRAMERHASGDARVIPIIVDECDWHSVETLKRLKALPRDAKPISEWTNPNSAYLDIVRELRRIVETQPNQVEAEPRMADQTAARSESVPSSRYRVKRDFDEIDKLDFRETAFALMKEYFERAAAEINTVDDLRARFVDRGPSSFGCTVLNLARKGRAAHITVRSGSGRFALGDIYFSYSEDARENSANGGFNIASNEYELFLEETMNMFGGDSKKLTAQQAAEGLWNNFIEQAGISYA